MDVPVEYQKALESILRARERAKASYEANRDAILQKRKSEREASKSQRRPVGRPRKLKTDEPI
jgi:hypothetical protein